jgi:hypothetical protein
LGKFIVTTTPEVSANSTSIYTTAVRFPAGLSQEDAVVNAGPFKYSVTKTGYYCVGAVPLSTELASDSYNSTILSTYTGVADFENTFIGHLPAAEYPKCGSLHARFQF